MKTFLVLVFISVVITGVLALVAFGVCELLNRALFRD